MSLNYGGVKYTYDYIEHFFIMSVEQLRSSIYGGFEKHNDTLSTCTADNHLK